MSGADDVFTLRFGVKGNDSSHLAVGWSFPEDGFTWTLGDECMILLDRPSEPGDYLLQVNCKPATEPPDIPAQRVYVMVNRWFAGKQILDRYRTIVCRIGWSVIRDQPRMSVGFLLPDAFRPCDVSDSTDMRRIALAVSRMTLVRLPAEKLPMIAASASAPVGRTVTEIARPLAETRSVVPKEEETDAVIAERLLEFESLGADAEFGLVQRSAGAEPLALLRFAEAPIETLLAALASRFEGIGEPGNVAIELRGREFMVRDGRYGFLWHSWTYEGQANPRQVQERETRNLQFLRSKLVEDLQQGHKLLLYKRAAPLASAELDRLLTLLRGYGPTRLLVVEEADATHPPGTAERVGAHLLRGRVSRFAPPDNATDIATRSWLRMARAAHRLWRDGTG